MNVVTLTKLPQLLVWIEALFAWVKKKQSGNLSHCSGGYRYSKIDKEQLLAFIQNKPDAYLYEIAQVFDCSSFVWRLCLSSPIKQ